MNGLMFIDRFSLKKSALSNRQINDREK